MAATQKKSVRKGKQPSPTNKAPARGPLLNRLIFGLALFGILVSVHLWIQAERGFAKGCLGLSDPAEVGVVECSGVVESDAGKLFGISNIVFGFLFFGTIAVLAFGALISSEDTRKKLRRWAFYLTSLGLLYALYLFIYQIFVLGQFCVLCLTTAAVTLLLFLLHLVEFRRNETPRFDVHGAVREIGLYSIMVLVAGLLLVAEVFFVNRIGTDAVAANVASGVNPAGDSVLGEDSLLAGLPTADIGVCVYDESMAPIEDLDALLADTPFLGDENAPVRIVKFFDPNCPHCKTLHDRMDSIREAVGDRARVYYKPFPIFPYSMTQVESMYVAARHGHFYEMIDAQLDNQSPGGMNIDQVVRLAGEVGMDPGEFRGDMNSGRVRRLVNRDRILIRNAGLRSVPKLAVEGRFVAQGSIRPACIASLVEQLGA